MIHVDRGTVVPPAQWREWARQATTQLELAMASGHEVDVLPLLEDRGLVMALERLFGGKCAYCESRVMAVSEPHVDRFRPSWSAIDLDGSTRRPAYWWLAVAWENLYLACAECSRNKGNRFPVAGARAKRLGARLANERAVLLDPCAEDPARHLLFAPDGRVASRSAVEEGIDRGAVTIDVLGLNRPGLVAARRAAAEGVAERVRHALAGLVMARPEADMRRLIAGLVDAEQPYVALQRQIALALVEQTVLADELGEEVTSWLDEARRSEIFAYQEAHEEDLRRTSVIGNPNIEARRSQAIESIELVNFRGVERLEMRFGVGSAERAGWTMLLGENGAGKSSILQALAIALMGAERLEQLGPDARPGDLLRRGEREGLIRVCFAADPEPLEVRLLPDAIVFDEASRRPRMFVLGFGAARWLPRPGGFEPDGDGFVRIHNLFNPFVPLADTIGWLARIGVHEFERTEEALLRLLQLEDGEQLVRTREDVLVKPARGRIEQAVSLRQLSDGYQSVMAMVGDVLDVLRPKRIDMAAAEGLVLVDEIGSHLHPRWRMQVVGRMRAAFPRLQFVVSTHDPLCLRGLFDGEVRLLQRTAGGCLAAIDELPSTEALSADQLLTSSCFGLHSTLDPELDARFEEYYELLAQRRRTRAERRRLQELRGELDRRELLGGTRRERELLSAIDLHLAREADALAEHAAAPLREETTRVLAEILSRSDTDL